MDILFACDGCFKGFPAIASLIIAVLVLVGSIYMLLAANFGVRQAYLILMVSLSGWMMIMSALWLFGAPGTTPGTGPRAREPQWVPFLATSEVGKEHAEEIATFPDVWDKVDPQQDKIYPGKIAAGGEIESVRALITEAEARLAAKNGTEAIKSDDWDFRAEGVAAVTPEDEKIPEATTRFLQKGNTLLFGVTIPATPKHPETTVFAYRDKGVVFLYALYFLLASIIGFVLHLMLLSRYEQKQKEEAAQLEPVAA